MKEKKRVEKGVCRQSSPQIDATTAGSPRVLRTLRFCTYLSDTDSGCGMRICRPEVAFGRLFPVNLLSTRHVSLLLVR